MHPALQIDEVLRQILDFLLCNKQRSNLLQLALACKSFRDPALDALWSLPLTQRELLHPFFVWGLLKANNYGVLWRLVFRHVPSSDDWKRYANYAQRVRSVRWRNRHQDCVTLDVLKCLLNAQPPIFPSLVELHLDVLENRESDSLFSLLLSPSLRRINIRMSGMVDQDLLIRRIADAAPGLEHLSIFADYTEPNQVQPLGSAVVMVICSNKELTKLSAILRRSPLAVINNTVLQSSTLTSLTLTIPGTYYPERNGGLKLQPIDCPLLESLELHCDNETSYMDQDFPGSRMPHLKRFHVTIDAPLYPEEVIQPFFRSVMRCGPNRLKSLSLHSRWAKTPVDLAIKIEHLHPLMNPPLAGLDSIHISGYFRSRLTNQDLVSLGRANPHLTKLHIGPHLHQKQSVSPDIFWDPRPEIDLQGLISFIHTLPTLLYLGISVSALPRSTPIGFESPGLVVPGLRKWDVCVSDIEEPEKVASMLITHLPHLEQVIMHQVMIFWPRFHPLMTSTSDFPENRDLKRCMWGFRVVDDLVREAHATRKAVL